MNLAFPRNRKQDHSGHMRSHKLNPTLMPGGIGITGVGQSISPAGGDPFEQNIEEDEWEIMDELGETDDEEDDKEELSNGDPDQEAEYGERVVTEDVNLDNSEIEALLESALERDKKLEEGVEPDQINYVKRVKFKLKG